MHGAASASPCSYCFLGMEDCVSLPPWMREGNEINNPAAAASAQDSHSPAGWRDGEIYKCLRASATQMSPRHTSESRTSGYLLFFKQ